MNMTTGSEYPESGYESESIPTNNNMTIVRGVGKKEMIDSKLGIVFTRASPDSPLMIKSIKDDSVFLPTNLRPGMIVHSVMGEIMTWKTPKDAADLLRMAEPGDVTLEALVYMAEIIKDDKSAKLGISFKNSTTKPGIFIAGIQDTGPFASSQLAMGQQIIYINDIPCPSTVKEAITLVKEAEGKLKIITIPTDWISPTSKSTLSTPPTQTTEQETAGAAAAAAATTTKPDSIDDRGINNNNNNNNNNDDENNNQ